MKLPKTVGGISKPTR
ncbi:MAG: hypothetical protein LBS73_02860 [Campylobacteraceae bacterium]|nr:hypothetical protein [Campylobacteraceae bacterium]